MDATEISRCGRGKNAEKNSEMLSVFRAVFDAQAT